MVQAAAGGALIDDLIHHQTALLLPGWNRRLPVGAAWVEQRRTLVLKAIPPGSKDHAPRDRANRRPLSTKFDRRRRATALVFTPAGRPAGTWRLTPGCCGIGAVSPAPPRATSSPGHPGKTPGWNPTAAVCATNFSPSSSSTACLKPRYVLVADWRQEYNTYRLHSALGMLTPTEFAQRWSENTNLSSYGGWTNNRVPAKGLMSGRSFGRRGVVRGSSVPGWPAASLGDNGPYTGTWATE
jgi:hypothetical protein